MMTSFRFSSGFLSRYLFFSVLLAVFLTYAPSLGNDFVNWDDDVHILENRSIRSLDLPHIKEMFTTTVNHTYLPLTLFTFALEYDLFGPDPFVIHFDNLMLHLIVTALVMTLARSLGLSVAAAALAALIFGVHPLHVESVSWATQRKDVLYSVFYLLSVLTYLRFLDVRRTKYLVLSIVLGLLSVLSKSMALSLPLVLLLFDWFYKKEIQWRDIFTKGYYIAIMIPVAWMSYLTNASILKAQSGNDLLIWIWCFNFYLIKFIVPGETALFYPLPVPVTLSNFIYLSSVLIFAALAVWLWLRRKDRWVVFAAGYYLASIFFVLRFHPTIDVIADRFMYLPSVGWCILFAVFIERLLKKTQKNFMAICVILCALTVAICGLLWSTQERSMVWSDSVSLWRNQLKTNSITARWLAYDKLGDAYLEDPAVHEVIRRLADDRRLSEQQMVDPSYAQGQRQTDTDRVLAVIDLYHRAIEERPSYAEPYYHLGRVYQALGDIPTAMYFYGEACRRDHAHFMAFLKMGELYKEQGNAGNAVEMSLRAVMFNNSNPETIATVQGMFNEAIYTGDHPEIYRAGLERLRILQE